MPVAIARYELTSVHTSPNSVVDIIFLHGLNGHPASTWRSRATNKQGTEGGTFWPSDLLPKALRNAAANILVYGYNADLDSTAAGYGGRSQSYLDYQAKSLVSLLTSYRVQSGSSSDDKLRPILWVAHSLGGTLVKAALNYSSGIEDGGLEDQRGIYISTYGVLFLGTPHSDLDTAAWQLLIQRIADISSAGKLTNPGGALLKTLEGDGETFLRINREFLQIQQRFKIIVAYENQKTDVKGVKTMVVEPPGTNNSLLGVTYYGIEANHSSICQFDEVNAPGFLNTSTALREWALNAPDVIRRKWQTETEGRLQRSHQFSIGPLYEHQQDISRLVPRGSSITATFGTDTFDPDENQSWGSPYKPGFLFSRTSRPRIGTGNDPKEGEVTAKGKDKDTQKHEPEFSWTKNMGATFQWIPTSSGSRPSPPSKGLATAAVTDDSPRPSTLVSYIGSSRSSKSQSINTQDDDARAVFDDALANSDAHALKKLLGKRFDEIAKDEFQWLSDMRDVGMEPKDMVDILLKTFDDRTWATIPLDMEQRLESAEQYKKIPDNFHQTSCAHKLGTLEPKQALSFGALAFDERHNVAADSVAWLCGLAGVLPPAARNEPSSTAHAGAHQEQWARAEFQDSTARVTYDSDPSSSNQIAELLTLMRRVQTGVIELQRYGICCDRFTVLSIPHRNRGLTASSSGIALKSISFASLNALTIALERVNIRRAEKHIGSALRSSGAFGCSRNILIDVFGYPSSFPLDANPLHTIMLTIQMITLGLVLYCRSYVGEFHPPLVKEPLSRVTLLGSGSLGWPVLVAQQYRLACMAPMLQDEVFAFSSHWGKGAADHRPAKGSEFRVVGTCESIVDIWGPASIIAEAEGSSAGQKIHGLRIGGGVIARSKDDAASFHWSPDLHYYYGNPGDEADRSFTYWERIQVGAPPTINSACNFDEEASYKMSAPWLMTCGTEPSKWVNDERQFLFQGGQFVQMSVGNVYHKVPKRTLKAFLLDTWAAIQDVRVFNYLFGVQVSLCTGVARRVPLRALVEEPLLRFVDKLRIEGWSTIQANARKAFAGEIDFDDWLEALSDDEHRCVRQVCGRLLELLKNTGFDRDGGTMRVMWPTKTNPYLCVTAVPEKAQIWWRILRDSEWCATFAVATSLCLETTEVGCRLKRVVPWHGGGTLFATAMYPSLKNLVSMASGVPETTLPPSAPGQISAVGSTSGWALQDGTTYWIGQPGADTWVLVRKPVATRSSTELYVKQNVFPRSVARWMWQDRVLRERSDATFVAEEVLVQHLARTESRVRVP